MINVKLDSVNFKLKESHNFSWLKSIGKVFAVFSESDSGNICFGVDDGNEKFFLKVAGLKTIESSLTQEQAISNLKAAVHIYEDIKHKSLIKLIKHYSIRGVYVAIFGWTDGECLFDPWNFEKYKAKPEIISPAERFKQLSVSKRLQSADVLFSFLDTISIHGYVGVDFYDGSIMYDFTKDMTKICDIDFFSKKPVINNIGENYWGSKRLKAPEEYIYGAIIDESTNVFTLGALLFDSFFGNYTKEEVRLRYETDAFIPCSIEQWELSRGCFDVILKAVSVDRTQRYSTINDFYESWKLALFTK